MTSAITQKPDRALLAVCRLLETCRDIQLHTIHHYEAALEYEAPRLKALQRGTKAYGMAQNRIALVKGALSIERARLEAFVDLQGKCERELDRRGYPRGEIYGD
jgi:hypothetical protein